MSSFDSVKRKHEPLSSISLDVISPKFARKQKPGVVGMRKVCPRCNSKIVHNMDFCMNCGYFVEKQFNEPMMWLGWDTY